MKKLSLDDTDINILVKKSLWLFWIGLIILLGPLIGFSIGLGDALMYESEQVTYCLLMLLGFLGSLTPLLFFVVKTNPKAVRKKYENGYKIIEELSIEGVRASEHRSDNSSGYTLYYMKLSNGEEYSIEYPDYKSIEEGKIKSARLETAERNGKVISCKVIKPASSSGPDRPFTYPDTPLR